MLDVLNNLDTVNFIIQDCISTGMKRELCARNAFYVGDGYAMDTSSTKGNGFTLKIRTDTLQTLSTILFEKNAFYIRYNHKFFLKYNIKTDMITCNLFDEPFELHEMESTFLVQDSIGFGLINKSEFSYDVMAETIVLCKGAYHVYEAFIQTKN